MDLDNLSVVHTLLSYCPTHAVKEKALPHQQAVPGGLIDVRDRKIMFSPAMIFMVSWRRAWVDPRGGGGGASLLS